MPKYQIRYFWGFSNSARVLVKSAVELRAFGAKFQMRHSRQFLRSEIIGFSWFCRKCYTTIVNCRYFCWSREGGASAPFLLLCSSPASLELLSSWRSRSLSIIKQWMLQWGSWRTRQRKDSNCEKMPQKL